jgi:hypothetical protein
LIAIRTLQNISQAFAEGLRRFPLVILAGIFGVAAIITCNHTDSETLGKLGLRIAWAVAVAFPLLVAAAYAGELFPRSRWIFQSAAATASAVPGLVKNPKSNWWRTNIGALNALILAQILSLVVLIGLMLALESLRSLFHLELSRVHEDIMAVCGFLFLILEAEWQKTSKSSRELTSADVMVLEK